MKIAVTGATGFIGRKLVSQLLSLDHAVRVLGRDREKASRLFGDTIEFHEWSSELTQCPKGALQGADAVIHLAGEGIADRRWTEARKKRLEDSRVLGTRNIVSTLKLLGPLGPKSFVCASAIGFYGDRKDEILSEASSPGTGFLAHVCSSWEKEALEAAATIRTVTVRIGIVLGKEGGALKKLLPLFRLGIGGPVGDGQQWMSWIHVDDLARLLIEASTNPKYHFAVNGVAPKPVTNKEFARALGKVLHRPAVLPAPALALKLVMGELSALVLDSQRVFPNVAEENQFSFRFPELGAALKDVTA